MSSKTHGRNVKGRRKRAFNSKLRDQVSKREKKDVLTYGELDPFHTNLGTRTNVQKVTDTWEEEVEEEESGSSSEEESAYQLLVASVGNTAEELDSDEIDNSDGEKSDEEESEGDNAYDKYDLESDDSDAESDQDSNSQEYEAKSGNEKLADLGAKEFSDNDLNPSEDEETSDIEVIEAGDEKQDFLVKENDPFSIHFERDLEEDFAESLNKKETWKRSKLKIPHFGHCLMVSPKTTEKKNTTEEKNLKAMHVKHKLCDAVENTNRELCGVAGKKTKGGLTSFQQNIFQVLNQYQKEECIAKQMFVSFLHFVQLITEECFIPETSNLDLYYPERSAENGEEIRLIYCLHALNHVLKTRSRVITHNTKLKSKEPGPDTEDYRDQGLTRPKVLIVLPFRDSALRVVNVMTNLLMSSEQSLISNKKRFQTEFGEENPTEKKGLKPEDYEKTFVGNIDDHFRIGLGVAKKTLKLYTKFYSSDIILASPLGLRTIIGVEGEKERDYDFLNSIEMLIFDQTDIFLMQNWDHIMQLLSHLHLQPQEAHGVDFSRVRMWTLNGWSKFYRQTLIFSSLASPELNSLFNKHCHNYAGKMMVHKKETAGTISQIVTQLPQVFHRVDCLSVANMADSRFDFFVKKVLPHHKDPVMSQTFIYIPSYFDFVRLRNHFGREEMDFVHISEYSNNKQISRARTLFFHGKAHFMLYTERLHFFKRYKVRGIRHIIFYELPLYPHFYSEFCNMLQDTRNRIDKETITCTVMYSQYDAQRLSGVVGNQRAGHMINSTKKVHMFVTGENT